jgi:hypothetical protein
LYQKIALVDKDLQENHKYNPMQESLPLMMRETNPWCCPFGYNTLKPLPSQVFTQSIRIGNPLLNSSAGKA